MDVETINELLTKRGITVNGEYFNQDLELDKKSIMSQINLIVDLHKIFIGCKFDGLSRIKSTIGKEVESYKVQIRKLEKHYDALVDQYYQSDTDKLILANGVTMLNKAKEAVKYIYNNNYFCLINRSMNREEICIGKVGKNNLRRRNDEIEIGTIKGLTYNLVEEDLYNYIKRLQRKQIEIDEDELIKLFVHESHLSYDSFEYLRGLCSYPKDFLKTWEKYKDGKKENSKNEVLLSLKKSLSYESKNFIRVRA